MQLDIVKSGRNVTISYEQPVKPYHTLVARLVSEYSSNKGAVSLLDVGCGTGNTLVELEKHGVDAKLSIADIDQACIEIVERRVTVSCSYHISGAEELETSNDGRYQFILYSHVLQYEEHPKQTISHLTKMLADDGYLILAVSNVATLPKFLNSAMRRQYSEGIVTWDKSTISNLIDSIPLCRLVSWHHDYVPLPLLGSSKFGVMLGTLIGKLFPDLCFSIVAVLEPDR